MTISLFDFLGVALVLYVGQCLYTGEVYAKDGAFSWGRKFLRAEEPFSYWSTVTIYGVGGVLLVIFL